MKKLEINVIKEDSEKIEQVLKENELNYVASTVQSGDRKLCAYSALFPDELVSLITDAICGSMDLRISENTFSVYNVDAHISTFADRLKEKVSKELAPRNSVEALLNATERYARPNRDLILMALFASLVALYGLFLDNVAILIGAMIISPLLGPINSFAVNANLGRIRKVASSQISIIILLLSVTLVSALTTFVLSGLVSLDANTVQIAIRRQASLVDLGVGVILGFAGGLALFVALPEILVGITIAVALVPPATVAGIGLARLDPGLFSGALILTFVYLVGLELGSTLMLRLRGVTPRHYYQKLESKRRLVYSIGVLFVLLILLGVIVALT